MRQAKQKGTRKGSAGFSLVELLVAMGITLLLAGLASVLLGQSFSVRARENRRAATVAGSQRALSIISRQLANAGFGLNPSLTNGIVATHSNNTQLRIRADLNGNGRVDDQIQGGDPEDVLFMVNASGGRRSLISFNTITNTPSVLTDRIDILRFRYYASRINYTPVNVQNDPNSCDILPASGATEVAPNQARYIVIVLCSELPQVGSPNQPGFQPAKRIQLISDVAIRNSNLREY